MPMRCVPPLVVVGSTLALMLVLASCTPGGQFDPTELLSSDIINPKKKLTGDREPVFPNGVPGAENGVPPELVKGYQQPPEQSVDNAEAAAKVAAEPAKPKLKPKPKPKVARASPTPSRDPAWNQKSASPPAPMGQPAQSTWPASPQTAPAQQAAQPTQSVWPASPQTAPAQQAAQPAQSVWPAPPAPGTYSH
jgi:hypothetical protein